VPSNDGMIDIRLSQLSQSRVLYFGMEWGAVYSGRGSTSRRDLRPFSLPGAYVLIVPSLLLSDPEDRGSNLPLKLR
jgi:hypothetical protein